MKAKSIEQLSKTTVNMERNDALLKMFLDDSKEINKEAGVIRYQIAAIKKTLYIDHLFISFIETHTEENRTCNLFLQHCSKEMTSDLCHKVFNETSSQSSKTTWFYQRFARITASKFFECSRCNTPDGSLVAALMGARTFKGNVATKRGQKLELEIFNLLKKTYPDIRKCGILIRGDMPQFGASPDGVSKNYIFEIKCPFKTKTVSNYIDDNGTLKEKVYYQMQLQMLMCNKKKGILCVADPNFEENNSFIVREVDYNAGEVKQLVKKCEQFWEKCIFPLLK